VTALVVVAGKENPGGVFPTSTTLFSYLFQFGLPDTVLVLTKTDVWVATGPKKLRMMEEMIAEPSYAVPVTTKVHALNGRDATSAAAPYAALWESIVSAQEGEGEIKIGLMGNDLEFAPASFKASLAEFPRLQTHDVANAFAKILVHKDDVEIKCLVTSSSISKTVLKKIAVPQIEKTIDAGSQVQHHTIANMISEIYQTPGKISDKLADSTHVDCGIVPAIQSGGVYSFTEPLNTAEDLHFGCILVELGSRFKSYCSVVGRTYLIDAPDPVRRTYNFTVDLQSRLIAMCTPGTPMSAVYKAAVVQIESTRPDLLPFFVSNCGTSIGLENYESGFSFNAECDFALGGDMVVTIRVGFANVPLTSKKAGEKWQKYSTLLTDTILVKENPQVLTESPKKYSDISYRIEEDEDEDGADEEDDEGENKNGMDVDEPAPVTEGPAAAIMARRAKTRMQSGAIDPDRIHGEARRQAHQQELAKKQRDEALIRYPTYGPQPMSKQVTFVREYIAYHQLKDFPQSAPRNRIFVDTTNEAVLLPIYGQSVPYHIMMVKTVTKHDNYLKFTFRYPEANQLQQMAFKDPAATFLKEVMFRIAQPEKLNAYYKDITALKKKVTDRETKKAIEDSLVPQEAIMKPNGGPKLSHLSIRPTLGGKKTVGVLECHPNGFRFTTNKKGIVDITFKNIKHAFFQPSENDAIILIHFNLHQPLIVGKKKTFDVQFYTEVAESAQASVSRSSWGDADEIEQEQMERQMVNKLNKQFQTFCEASSAHTRDAVVFDSPYRNLGFDGIHSKDNVVFYPTTNCLVSLIVSPFFIVTLDEVEIVFFERVQFTLRLFDLVFVLKDYSKAPIHISAIPRNNLESIREWLDSCDVKHYAGPHNLNWKKLMKEVLEDPRGFWEDGGWATLEEEDSEEEGEEKDEEEEAAEEDFQPSGSDSGDYHYDEEEDDASYGAEEEEDWDEEDEEIDSADDWDAHERAAADDEPGVSKKKKSRRGDEDDDDDDDDDDNRPKKKKSKAH
jgi:nucleosome binding factor SPN SPT16 subunit